jgi:hypothetical protein
MNVGNPESRVISTASRSDSHVHSAAYRGNGSEGRDYTTVPSV